MMVISVDAWHAEVRDSPEFMSAQVHVILLLQIAHSAVSMKLIEKSWIGSNFELFDHMIRISESIFSIIQRELEKLETRSID